MIDSVHQHRIRREILKLVYFEKDRKLPGKFSYLIMEQIPNSSEIYGESWFRLLPILRSAKINP